MFALVGTLVENVKKKTGHQDNKSFDQTRNVSEIFTF